MPKPNLASLGNALDRAECDVNVMIAADHNSYFASPDSVDFDEYVILMQRLHDAALAYTDVLTTRNDAAKIKFDARRSPVLQRDATKLKARLYDTEERIDLFEQLGPHYYTKREFYDALSAYQLADWTLERAQTKFRDQEHLRRADRRAGIVRR